jgi:EmrB/QacA subfamily drug resistance transporter
VRPFRAVSIGRSWWVLVGSCLGLFVLMLDSTEVVLALPVIDTDLGLSEDGLQWVQNAYLLVLAATVTASGRLGDIIGRRRVYIGGVLIFALGTLLAALSTGQQMLIAARLIQGLGGSAMFALSLAIASNAFPRERQATAVGIWAAISSIALGIGPLLGGVLVGSVGWRWIFWTYLPFCAAAIIIIRVFASETRDEKAGQRIDKQGAVTVTAGLALVVLALVESEVWGAAALVPLAAGLVALAAFWAIERRAPEPLIDFSLFENRVFLGASVAALALVGSYWTTMFYEPLFLQGSLRYSAVAAGALILPITVPTIFISPFTGTLMKNLGARRLLVGGLLVAGAAVAAITLLGRNHGYAAVFVPYLVYGIALAMVYAPVSSAAMAALPRAKAGVAAGALGMVRLMTGALVLAASGAIFQNLNDTLSLSGAISAALIVPAAVLLIGAAIAFRLLPGGATHEHPPRIEHHRLHF